MMAVRSAVLYMRHRIGLCVAMPRRWSRVAVQRSAEWRAVEPPGPGVDFGMGGCVVECWSINAKSSSALAK